ncbi:beta-lactamase family protein [Acinetobacter indicus]|uniref:Beta-lactamase family protein n=1 Tax=Acinetobacter indicus TaxID=756892 RepID=A0A7S6VSA2_9GAMM|nr:MULTISPECIES: serine hydrolase domain-containing protein [Acinetobacter]QIC76282.1 beta-lactamase family protein [Acinetobacter indicus]QOW44004.1 beta-lactamase family protein [Acinetobacter indicus]
MNSVKDYLRADIQNYRGSVEEPFKDLAHLFSRFQDARSTQGGAALVVYFQGHKVVDIYTGQKSANEAWQPDSLSVCYSTGKGVLATLAHILVSQGRLDYDVPVAEYWPEFAAQGKQQLTLREMLCHRSGLYDIRNLIADASEMADWSHMLEVIAAAKPRFLPNSDAAYQPLTFGWQVGGVLEKACNESLAVLMQRHLSEPLELNGAYFGVPVEELARVARPFATSQPAQYAQPPKKQAVAKPARTASPLEKLMAFSGQHPQDFQDAMIPKGMKKFSFFSDAGLQAIVPAASGVFTAQSLAKIYAMLAQGGQWQGQRLISPQVFQALSQVQYTARDRVMPLPMHWRLGYHRILSLGKSASSGFGHIGFNGSGAWCDPERNLSFAYTHNFPTGSITGDYRLWGLTQETLRCADGVLKGRKGWF